MATLAVLADAASRVNTFIDVFLWVYILLIFVYVLTSWVQLPYSIWVRRMTDFLRDVCEPYLRIFRRILPPLGALDLSPVVAMLALIALMRDLVAKDGGVLTILEHAKKDKVGEGAKIGLFSLERAA